jgi:hypothetical protein
MATVVPIQTMNVRRGKMANLRAIVSEIADRGEQEQYDW